MELVLGGFKRISEIDKGYKLWSKKDPIDIFDLAQGYTVGNCYFIAALCALTNKPELIKRIF
jgi:hypothetical protein